jgi:hypothetical protein
MKDMGRNLDDGFRSQPLVYPNPGKGRGCLPTAPMWIAKVGCFSPKCNPFLGC